MMKFSFSIFSFMDLTFGLMQETFVWPGVTKICFCYLSEVSQFQALHLDLWPISS